MSTLAPPSLEWPAAITTARLEIRPPRIEDAPELNAAVRETLACLRPWMDWAQEPPTLAETEANLRRACERFEAREDFRLHLFLKGTNTLIGGSGLHGPDWRVPKFEIGYWVRASYARQGYITEAVRGIAGFAFTNLSAQRVIITLSARNERSARVAERAGFTLEGTLRNNERLIDGALSDTMMYAKVV